MNINVEKIELIKRLIEVEDGDIIKKLKAILVPQKEDETERIRSHPDLARKVKEAREEIKEGKGVKMDVKNLWK
jgi:2-oxo-4-hydroxy-4-carboxy--5-ureidoimidazoline (OHCU) decarboxylase